MRAFAFVLLAVLPPSVRAQNTISGTVNSGALVPGLVTFQGGTLQAAGGVVSNDMTLASGGGVDAIGKISTLSGVIGGAGGSLTFTDGVGGGEVILSGANAYNSVTSVLGAKVGFASSSAFGAGSVSLNGATLRARAAGLSLANPIQLNGADVFDANGFNPTFSGPIFGGGSLALVDTAGGGSLTFGAGSYYSGGTAIAAGLTVGLAARNALGSGQVSLSGATLRLLAAGADLPNALRLAGANVVDAAGNAGTFSGPISGAGSLALNDSVGGGVLTLGGPGSWTGGTTLNAGILRMNAAGVMPAAGTLTVGVGATFDMNGFGQRAAATVNNGTLKTGAATLTIAGNYSGGGTLSVTPLPTGPNLSVSGAATLTGQTLALAGRPATGNYVIVASGGGLGGTTFGALTGLPSGYRDVLTYTADAVLLALYAPSYVQAGQNSNQRAVASALDQENASASNDMAAVLAELNGFTPAQLNAALDQISPVGCAAMSGLAFADADLHSAAVRRRVAALQAGVSGSGDMVAYDHVSGSSRYPGPLVADAGGGPVPIPDPRAAAMESPWGLFFSGLDTMGRMSGVEGSAGFQPGYNFTTFGGMTGVDYRFSEDFAAGFTGGYMTGASSLESGRGAVSNGSLRFGLYATSWGDVWRGDFYLGGAADSFSTTRRVVFGAENRSATASPGATELNLGASISRDLSAGAWTLTPSAGFSYDRLMIESFSEGGAGALDLDVNSQTADSFRSDFGTKVGYRFDFGGGSGLTPFASAAWEHEFVNQSRSISAEFATGTAALSVATADVARDGLLASAGLSLDFDASTTLRLSCSSDRRKDFSSRTCDGSFRVRF